MQLPLLRHHLMKIRVTLATLGVFLPVLWSLAWFVTRELRLDMGEQAQHQQQSALALLKHSVDQSLLERLHGLEAAAQGLAGALPGRTSALQQLLKNRPLLQRQFAGGLVVLNQKNQSLAELPLRSKNLSPSQQPPVPVDLLQGHAAIGALAVDPAAKAALVAMTAPIRNQQQQVLGVLVGVLDLSRVEFLGVISNGQYGHRGGYLLIDTVQRRIIAASDAKRVLEELPPPGVEPAMDKFLLGYSGTQVLRNPDGEEVLASAQRLTSVPWLVAVTTPTEEVFAPVRAMQQRLLLATALASLLAALLVWWLMHDALTPLFDTIKHLVHMSETPQAPRPLPVKRQDELGLLVTAFNALLQRQASVQSELLRHTDMLGRTEAVANIGSWRWQVATDKVTWSAQMFRIFQLDPAHGAPSFAEHGPYFPAPDMQRLRAAVAQALADRLPYELELRVIRADGTQRICKAHGRVTLGPEQRVTELYGTLQDITEMKTAEMRLQLASNVFHSAYEGITITDADASILDINDSFTRITGYSRDEVVGKNPRLLQSGRQDVTFYQALWASLLDSGHWCGEIWNRRKSGEIYPEWLDISAVRDDLGVTQQYVAVFSDITARKELEERVRQMAFYDPLTALPNRRLLTDRLGQALLFGKRNGMYGALMFLDLDNFKPLNDTHGHAMGDLLLIEVARRLQACVRQNDTVARIGGDEFVVMLTKLGTHAEASQAQALAIAEKIRSSLAQTYCLTPAGHAQRTAAIEHHCSCSIGLVLFAPGQDDQDAIVEQADAAMYQAKAAGRNRVVLVSPPGDGAVKPV